MKKSYLLALLVLSAGILCFITYSIIGATVGADGMLQEPFWLIPTGMLCIVISLMTAFVVSLWALFHTPNKIDKLFFILSLSCSICIILYLTASFSYLDALATQEITSPAPSYQEARAE